MDLKTFTSAVYQLAEERGISREKVMEIVEQAIAAAYKKEYGEKGQKIVAKLDPKTGKAKFWRVKIVVDKNQLLSDKEIKDIQKGKLKKEELEGKIKFNPQRHVILEEAKKINPKIKVGEEIKIPLPSREKFGRIATQTAKQVI